MNKFRLVTAGAVAIGVAVALVGCSSGASDTPSNGSSAGGSKDATINIVLNSNSVGAELKPLIAQYTKDTGRKVNVQVLAEAQMQAKEQLNLQSKSAGMDVFMTLPSREGPLFEQSGYYEPLDSYLSKAQKGYTSGFSPAAIKGMKINGKTVAVPMNVEGPVMFYRKDILKKDGIAVPKTVDQLMTAAKTIAADGDSSYVPVTLRGQASPMAYDFGSFFHAQGLEWATNGQPNFDKTKAATAIDQYATLASKYGPKGVINYSFQESTNLFTSGGAAFELESSNEISLISDSSKSKVVNETGVANMPGGIPAILSWGLAISPFSTHKTAAWEFLQWATGEKTQLNLALKGIAPPRTDLFDNPKYTATLDNDVLKEWKDAILYILKQGNPEVGPVGSQAPAIRLVIGNGVGSVILGQTTAEEAAKSIQSQLVPLLKDQQK